MSYSQAQRACTPHSVNIHSCIPFLSGCNNFWENNPLRHCVTSVDQDCAKPEPHRTYYLGKLHPHRFFPICLKVKTFVCECVPHVLLSRLLTTSGPQWLLCWRTVVLALEMFGGRLICDAKVNRGQKRKIRGCINSTGWTHEDDNDLHKAGVFTGNRSHNQREDNALLRHF